MGSQIIFMPIFLLNKIKDSAIRFPLLFNYLFAMRWGWVPQCPHCVTPGYGEKEKTGSKIPFFGVFWGVEQ